MITRAGRGEILEDFQKCHHFSLHRVKKIAQLSVASPNYIQITRAYIQHPHTCISRRDHWRPPPGPSSVESELRPESQWVLPPAFGRGADGETLRHCPRVSLLLLRSSASYLTHAGIAVRLLLIAIVVCPLYPPPRVPRHGALRPESLCRGKGHESPRQTYQIHRSHANTGVISRSRAVGRGLRPTATHTLATGMSIVAGSQLWGI